MFTGPSRGCRHAGRARREQSAIVGSKNRVRVPNFRYPEIVAQIGQRTANIGISTGYVDNLRQNQLFVVNIIRKSRDKFDVWVDMEMSSDRKCPLNSGHLEAMDIY